MPVIKSVSVNGTVWTKDRIKDLLRTNDEALKRSILRIYDYQTRNEQLIERTEDANFVGFNGVDSFILSSFAVQLQSRKWLSEKQLVIARKKMPKYAGQLLLIMADAQPANPNRV